MLDQSFSAENFRKIFDLENRKGIYIEGKFFPEIEQISKDLKKCAGEYKSLKSNKGNLDPADYEKQEKEILAKKAELTVNKENLLAGELEKASHEVSDSKFKINLSSFNNGGKVVYTVDEKPASYFALKQVQYNIAKLYKVKQASRQHILCQLRDVLNDHFPKLVLRTDIRNFFESIPRERLLKQINKDPLLTLSSKNIIKQVLKEFGQVSSQDKGVPRGVGISAYLSELYLRKVDEKISRLPHVTFYARYVDDIVVVCSVSPYGGEVKVKDEVAALINEVGLELNDEKTSLHDLTKENKKCKLDYLGYEIKFGDKNVEFNLSNKKLKRYKDKIAAVFSGYTKRAKTNEKKARKLLVKRLRFLTSNTKLWNNKKHALVGIYFSNNMLSDSSASLTALDAYTLVQIKKLQNPSLELRLQKFSFKEGFSLRKFTHFSSSSGLAEIVSGWKNVA